MELPTTYFRIISFQVIIFYCQTVLDDRLNVMFSNFLSSNPLSSPPPSPSPPPPFLFPVFLLISALHQIVCMCSSDFLCNNKQIRLTKGYENVFKN